MGSLRGGVEFVRLRIGFGRAVLLPVHFMSGSVYLLYTKSTKIFGTSTSETTMRPDPSCLATTSAWNSTRAPGWPYLRALLPAAMARMMARIMARMMARRYVVPGTRSEILASAIAQIQII